MSPMLPPTVVKMLSYVSYRTDVGMLWYKHFSSATPPTSRVGRSYRTSWLWMRPGLATPGCSRVVRLRVEAPLQAEALCPPAPDAATIPATTSAIVDLTYNSVLPHPPQTSTYLPGLGYELPAYGAGV